MENVCCVKFNNGIEWVAEMVKFDNSMIVFKEPRQIVQIQQHGQVSISLVPVALSIDPEEAKEIVVQLSSLMFMPGLASQEFVDAYQQTVTGIALPSKSIIMG
jgi:hypothetical protein